MSKSKGATAFEVGKQSNRFATKADLLKKIDGALPKAPRKSTEWLPGVPGQLIEQLKFLHN